MGMSQLAGRKGEKEGGERNIIHYMILAEESLYRVLKINASREMDLQLPCWLQLTLLG